MGNGEYAKQVDAYDPLGSIFLPRTNNPEAEFSVWQAQILLRRGIAAGASFEEQCRLQEQLDMARRHYMGAVALQEGEW
ncbi:hypothetical protein B7Z00_03565 [Candidatus Saccharibacteria bacterium 32-50-10]|nr:MAG: hypothetical protein B7Z00_03565 [Candidatus Saccharibacteria bacterium 32-50-10]